MSYTQIIDGCLEPAIGEHGLPPARLAHWLEALTPGFKALQAKAHSGEFPHFRIIDETADLDEAKAALARLCVEAQTLVVLGTGGSSLGGQALAQLGGWFIPGDNGAFTGKIRPRTRASW
jgi:glucose-6-phosphate isomerase